MEIGFLIGMVIFTFSGLVMLNPAIPVPDDKENFRIVGEKLKQWRIWGHKEQ